MGTQGLHSLSLRCNSEVLARGEIIYQETKLLYSPDVVEAWKDHLQRRLSFLGVQLDWQYTDGRFAQLRALGDHFEAATEEMRGKNSLEYFAQTFKRPP